MFYLCNGEASNAEYERHTPSSKMEERPLLVEHLSCALRITQALRHEPRVCENDEPNETCDCRKVDECKDDVTPVVLARTISITINIIQRKPNLHKIGDYKYEPALWFASARSAVTFADDASAHVRKELEHPTDAGDEEEEVEEEDDDGRISFGGLATHHEGHLQIISSL